MRKAYKLKIVVRSPFLFEGLTLAAHGFDASQLRGEDDRPIIPGDHIRGHLRHAIGALYGPGDMMDALFGSESARVDPAQGGEQNIPQRGALIVGDLIGPKPEAVGVYHRIAIDERIGAAATGMVQAIELTEPIGNDVGFEGRLVLRPDLRPNVEARVSTEDMADALRQALRLIPAVGAMKSAGFGEVVDEKSSLEADDKMPAAVAVPSGNRITFTVAFDRPLLVDSKRNASNSFASADIVPGAAIKGAVALALADIGQDMRGNEAFTALHISHAFPLAGEVDAARAVPDALAVAETPNDFLAADAFDLEGHLLALTAIGTPSFAMDWKNALAAARDALGRPEADLKRFPRGRVAIGENGVAEEGKLFVTETIGVNNRRWRFTANFTHAVAVRAAFVERLCSGVDGVGRTGARMTLTSAEASTSSAPQITPGTLRLLLETPAVLTDLSDAKPPEHQYAEYFRTFGGVTLKRHFARRRLAGDYYGFRFRGYGAKTYQPFELTEAGAVFEVMVDDVPKVQDLLNFGLPSARIVDGAFRAFTWSECPFVRENGYGEVSIAPDLGRAAQRMGEVWREKRETAGQAS